VVPVAALGQVTDRAHRRVSDGSIVAQDPEPVELCLDYVYSAVLRVE
jgi:hypothetical protein